MASSPRAESSSAPPGRPPVVAEPAELRARVRVARRAGLRIGCVPTMGALHAGHVSLVEASARECGFTVATIFVNPTQFGPHEDFQRYPRTLAADLDALSGRGCDLVFAPAVETIYAPGHATFVEPGGVALPWEGERRPGHFRGVATVVLKLFQLVQPDAAYFGQKDYQQSLVVRRMVADLDVPVEIRVCPIVREPDGLALSSRNVYLSPAERREALALSRGLRQARARFEAGERRADALRAALWAELAASPGVAVEYAEVVDAETLASLAVLDRPAVALVAARVGTTRLIDNERLG